MTAELARIALDFRAEERLELARRLVESVVAPERLTDAITEGIRRLEEVATGRVQGLTEEVYRAPAASLDRAPFSSLRDGRSPSPLETVPEPCRIRL